VSSDGESRSGHREYQHVSQGYEFLERGGIGGSHVAKLCGGWKGGSCLRCRSGKGSLSDWTRRSRSRYADVAPSR
jgi:hypothetical protein